MARELAPAGWRSRPRFPPQAVTSAIPPLRLLRSRAGASSLATRARQQTYLLIRWSVPPLPSGRADDPHSESHPLPSGEGACSRWVAQPPPLFPPKQSPQPYHCCVCCAAEREQAPSPQKPVSKPICSSVGQLPRCHRGGRTIPTLKATRSPVARELAPAGWRSRPRFSPPSSHLSHTTVASAAQPSGSKLPRHKSRQPVDQSVSSAMTSAHNFPSPHANHRLSFKQVRSICVNGSVDYGRFVANRFE
ncbi:hypothetical protein SAMN03159298_02275 [Pseudomonas sp. NFACC07-1]|nr:hypothetical protein SAMN03159298_02275 [Pseudomonas sp. NFACC07-1]